MSTFEQYLKDHQIEPLRLSVVAGVRYMTVWNATKQKPIAPEQARKIRLALQRLTGHMYQGPLLTTDDPPTTQLTTKRR